MDIRGDIKRYQETLDYASSKVDYSMEEHIYMLPSNMNLKIRSGTVGYNNKILISNEEFSLGKNDEVNTEGIGSANSKPEKKTTTKKIQFRHQSSSNMKMRKLHLFYFSWVFLLYGIFFDELVITKL